MKESRQEVQTEADFVTNSLMTVAPLPLLPILMCYFHDRLRKGQIT